MEHIMRWWIRLLLFPILGSLSAGCGVLTVDVDVYKGPLANHRDVQTQQTAMLALAAKPLLGKLRYELERFGRRNAKGLKLPGRVLDDPEVQELKDRDEFISDE